MENSKFAVILPIVIGGLINKIIEEEHIGEDEAFDKLYNSELYSLLESEETKVWTYSIPKLFELFQSEASTGKLEFLEY